MAIMGALKKDVLTRSSGLMTQTALQATGMNGNDDIDDRLRELKAHNADCSLSSMTCRAEGRKG